MAWNAKPSGAYALESAEGIENQIEYYNYFQSIATRDCIIGMLCNVFAESGLNPWRWQSDTVNLSGGYGLYQFTPASGYINLTGIIGHSPNMSTSIIDGGNISDAIAQMYVLANDTLSKWNSTCWRSYWSTITYADLYNNLRPHILNTYGDGTSLTMAQFFNINSAYDALFAFMACYEGPAVPNLQARAAWIPIIDGNLPQPTTDDWLYPVLYKYQIKRRF